MGRETGFGEGPLQWGLGIVPVLLLCSLYLLLTRLSIKMC